MELILASGSPRRKELTRLLGFSFTAEESGCGEDIAYKTPEQLVEELAKRKAQAVWERHREAVVLGADTVVCKGGVIFGKPRNREDARRMLQTLQGGSHQVVTGFAVVSGDGVHVGHEATTVHVCPMGEAELQRYLDLGEYADKAGGYAIQGAFSRYVTGISGCYHNVVGLPVSRIYPILTKAMNGKER